MSRFALSFAICAAMALGLFEWRRAQQPTFSRDVAPLVYARCAPCHHPGGAGPFSLLAYDDLLEHQREIHRAVSTRFMPPWKPAPGVAHYADDRSLPADQASLLLRWLEGGTPLGDAKQVPPAPVFKGGWQLGTPDLIVEPEAYDLPPDGTDVYRNLVIRTPLQETRFIAAWEILPGTRAIHHAILNVDRMGLARLKDAQDPGPGFGGLDPGQAQSPDGFYLVWTPGKSPSTPSRDTAWRLDAHTDLVLQLHMQPIGRTETVRPKIGLYFADHPPTRKQMVIRIGDRPIDIAPGDAHYVVTADYVLPASVEVVNVFPHAHYLARTVRTWATLPDGSDRGLLRIDDWDFSWQDQYTFAQPIPLPAGTTLHMEFVYDNSAANPRNQSVPPIRARTGERSVDEMGNVTFQVFPTDPRGMAALRLVQYQAAVAATDSAQSRYNLANALADLGHADEAIASYRRAVELEPAFALARFNLSGLLAARGDVDGAILELTRALESRPGYADAHLNLGNLLGRKGQAVAALAEFRAAVASDDRSALAHAALGLALEKQHDPAGAIDQFNAALAIDPANGRVHECLGDALRDRGQAEDAAAQYRRAIELMPNAPGPRASLAALTGSPPAPRGP
jgi:Tfp pilus assembly protein PilF